MLETRRNLENKGVAWLMFDTSKRLVWLFLIFAAVIESIGVVTNFKILVLLEDNVQTETSFKANGPLRYSNKETHHPLTVFLSAEIYQANASRVIVEDQNVMNPSEGWHKHPQPNDPVDVLGNPLQLDGANGSSACVAADWQSRFYPTCNAFHETQFDFGNGSEVHLDFLGNGQQRDAWKVSHGDSSESVVLKTLRMKGSFSQLTYHRQKVDAIVSERLTSSPTVIDMYGFCGTSAMNEMGVSYDVRERLTYEERIRFGRDVAAAMADLHEIGGGKHAMIAHGDVRRGNIMFSADKTVLKLHDFNQGSFLGWNKEKQEPCGFQRANAVNTPPRRDKFSAPEESYRQVLSAKTDVYHLGSILFYLMTGGKPYLFNKRSDLDAEGNPPLTDNWLLPDLPESKQHHTDPAIVTMKDAMYTCYRYKAQNRPSARDVFLMLNKTVSQLQQDGNNQ